MAGHGGSDRILISRHARDERRARDIGRIELSHPPRGERFRGPGVFPLQVLTELHRWLAPPALTGKGVEELCGEEVAVGVVQHQLCNSKCKMQNAKRKMQNGLRLPFAS